MRLESRKVEVLMKVDWKLYAVTCSHVQLRAVMFNIAENVECGSYPNLSKNPIKFKRSSVFSSLFVSIISWSSLLLFGKLSKLDCRSDC